MRIKRKILLWTLFVLIFGVVNSFGQTKCFKGTVKDANGALIADASIIIKNAKGKVVENTTSNNNGEFSLECVEDGDYSLLISKDGMTPIEKKVTLSREI
ncbi:MAG: carboxypeptidase-like regulatory domain-containing protein, partial [Pyrinomonadaceae bacterium]|nr:carboxypeptidase-like regulatory domain-containing protein [Pyrinomonadaceae bacterium]